MPDFTAFTHLFVIPVQMHQRQLQPVVIQIGANQVHHHRRAAHYRLRQRQIGDSAQVQLKLADGRAVLRPVTAVMHARRKLVNQQALRRDETFHRHHAHIIQLIHNRAQHRFGLLLLRGVRLWEGHAGAQNAVLMQVVGQRIKDRAAVMRARADQRHLAGKVNALLDDALAVTFSGQLLRLVFAKPPLAAAIVAAGAALDDSQLTEALKNLRPFVAACQQLPRCGREIELIEQLFLGETVGDKRENIAVNERVVARQLAGQGGFRPAFNFRRDNALRERHRLRIGVEPYRPDANAKRFARLAQHSAKLAVTQHAYLLHASPRGSGFSSTSSVCF